MFQHSGDITVELIEKKIKKALEIYHASQVTVAS